MIQESPNIVSTVSIHEGYVARSLCLVDGYPSEVRVSVDIRHQEYSRYDIFVFNPVTMSWDEVYSLGYADVGHMPVIGNDPDTLIELNTVAQLLWRTAQVVVTGAHRRQDEVDVHLYVQKRVGLEEAFRKDPWVAPEIEQGNFVLHGEVVHDEDR